MTEDTVTTSVTLAQRMVDEGRERAMKDFQEAVNRGAVSESAAGMAALSKTLEPVINAIAEFMVSEEAVARRPHTLFKLAGHMSPGVLAFCAGRGLLDKAMINSTLTSAALEVGTMVEDEERLAVFQAADKGLYKAITDTVKRRGSQSRDRTRTIYSFNANKKNITIPRWSKSDKIHIGVKLIELFNDNTGLCKAELSFVGRRKTVWKVRLTEKTTEWLKDWTVKQGLLRPRYLPMVTPPIDWTKTSGGGYPEGPLPPMPLVKRTFRQHVEELYRADLSVTFAGLNAIQKTAWKVNTEVLDVMKQAWEAGLSIGGMPDNKDKDLPEPLPEVHTEEEKRLWKLRVRDVHEANALSLSLRMEFVRLLSLATEFSAHPSIYFPHQLDFRGRCYAVPAGLQPQGADEARSLLTFANGKPLGREGMFWLAVHGANTFGYDKASLVDRQKWAIEHTDKVLEVVSSPLNNRWWTEADKPWSFLAWCFEWAKASPDYVCSLPVSLDGTCNGLQHFSAMLRDPVGGAAVNLVPADVPQDIYQRVADRVTELLRVKAADGDWIAQGWLTFGINRKITKRPVMVLPYGGTQHSCMQYVRDAVLERINAGEDNPFGDELFKACAALSSLVWASIGDVVIGARTVMGWLQDAAAECSARKAPIVWKTPSGFVAYQEYKELKLHQIKTRMLGKQIKLHDWRESSKLSAAKQSTGVSPNFVHSMDASAMFLTVYNCPEITSWAMIHDSYGTVPGDVGILAKSIRETFVSMYEKHDPLTEFALWNRIDPTTVPIKGPLNLQEVLKSPYFFS